MAFDLNIDNPFERVKACWNTMNHNNPNFGSTLPKFIHPLSSTNPTPTTSLTTFSLTIDPSLCNQSRNLHGGAAALIFDVCTSVAIAPLAKAGAAGKSKSDGGSGASAFWPHGGVSRTLQCTYLRPVPVGSRCIIECEVVGIGRRLCTVRGTIRRVVEGAGVGAGAVGEVCVLCEHGKVSVDPPVGGAKL